MRTSRGKELKMIERICRICGKKFVVKHSRQCTCSVKCSQENARQMNRQYVADPTYKMLQHKRYKARYQPKVHTCRICDGPLEDNRQKYCLPCLFREYLNGDRKKAYMVLRQRGFDTETIQYEISQTEL